MSNDNVEQEQDFEVVNLLGGDAPEPAEEYSSKYEKYAAMAEKEAAEAQPAEEDNVSEEHPATETTSVPDESPAIPKKFEGKSIEDVITAYTQLESEFGKRGNEIGQLRSLTDQLLELNDPNKAKAPAEETKPVDVDTLLEDPQAAITRVLEDNEDLKALKEGAKQERIAAAKQGFESAHPDWNETLHSEPFQEWVMKNPLRQRDLMHANQNYDYATAKALFDDYKETHGARIEQATQQRDTNARQAAKQAVTESGGNVQQQAKAKKFRRAELIELKIRDRARYESMREEIMAAYARGDVI